MHEPISSIDETSSFFLSRQLVHKTKDKAAHRGTRTGLPPRARRSGSRGKDTDMSTAYSFALEAIPFDESYRPCEQTRLTTNFANLARGPRREQNLHDVRAMIDNRFNMLAHEDNPQGDRYAVSLEIITATLQADIEGLDRDFPLIEMLQPAILDRATGQVTRGIMGNSLSSYVRDHDFTVVLPQHRKAHPESPAPDDFGILHGNLFKAFVQSDAWRSRSAQPPVICLSVSSSGTYRSSATRHPVLGQEYHPDASSQTDLYFERMGLRPRHFMPTGGVAPLTFYAGGDLDRDFGQLELIATTAIMESFQKIYRPEIYNANSAAPAVFRPSLQNPDHSLTRIIYDREERNHLALTQARLAESRFLAPARALLASFAA